MRVKARKELEEYEEKVSTQRNETGEQRAPRLTMSVVRQSRASFSNGKAVGVKGISAEVLKTVPWRALQKTKNAFEMRYVDIMLAMMHADTHFSRTCTTAHALHISFGSIEIESASLIHPVSCLYCFLRFPNPFFSSPPAPTSSPSASTAAARSWRQSPSAPARWRESGRLADSVPTTGCEPKLTDSFSCTDNVHTPIHFLETPQEFRCPDDATMIPASTRGLPTAGASSSSIPAATSKVPSLFGSTSLRRPGGCINHVSSRSSHQETEAEFDRESVATTDFQINVKRKTRWRFKSDPFVERSRESSKTFGPDS